MPRFLPTLITLTVALFLHNTTWAQLLTVSGTVYDITKNNPIEAVSVISTSGVGTSTDSLGRYTLVVNENDSIYFSFLNKVTPKYAVVDIKNHAAFDISIQKKIQQLQPVFVKQRNYRLDSLQNRADYEKIFNYKKPGLSTSMPSPGMAVGIDLDELINMFSFRKNKRMASFQRRLLQQESDKYVTYRFNKGLVRRLTGLNEPEIDSFMAEFRPTYDMAVSFNDLEMGQFVIEAFKYYKAGIKINKSALRREDN